MAGCADYAARAWNRWADFYASTPVSARIQPSCSDHTPCRASEREDAMTQANLLS
jgi:hypothetical protein